MGAGSDAEAQAAANTAKTWAIWSIILGAVGGVIWIILAVVGGVMSANQNAAMLAAMF